VSQDSNSSSIFHISQVEIFILMIFVLLIVTQIMSDEIKKFDKPAHLIVAENDSINAMNDSLVNIIAGLKEKVDTTKVAVSTPICFDKGKEGNDALFHIEMTPLGYVIQKNINGPLAIDKKFMPGNIKFVKENDFKSWADQFYLSANLKVGDCKFIYKRVKKMNPGWDALTKRELAQLPNRFSKMEDVIEGYFYRHPKEIIIDD